MEVRMVVCHHPETFERKTASFRQNNYVWTPKSRGRVGSTVKCLWPPRGLNPDKHAKQLRAKFDRLFNLFGLRTRVFFQSKAKSLCVFRTEIC